ncbi:MAG: hypothetical protein PHQ09_07215 [Actinomycetota bacterium]|nr:hypothetical protein [Actinomycetota bacterium]
MRFKTPAITILITGIISLFMIFTLFACTPIESKKIDVDVDENEVQELEESEEEIVTVDYENAQFGAEINGYIPFFLCTDNDNYIKIEITNTSDFTWQSDGKNPVRVGYHYYGQDVDYSEYDNNARTILPNDVAPGETVTVEVLINDITNEGIYVVQIDLVLEGYFWFSGKEIPVLQNNNVYFSSCGDGSES